MSRLTSATGLLILVLLLGFGLAGVVILAVVGLSRAAP